MGEEKGKGEREKESMEEGKGWVRIYKEEIQRERRRKDEKESWKKERGEIKKGESNI